MSFERLSIGGYMKLFPEDCQTHLIVTPVQVIEHPMPPVAATQVDEGPDVRRDA